MLCWFYLKISQDKRGDTTHIKVTLFKMVWLILITERCDETDQIDVTADVHVKVSHVMYTNVTHL
jgi:hypothetical protein